MIPSDQVAWRRAIGETAALPPDDPKRLEMHAEVARLGAWAETEWLSLLEEGERWRLELSRVDSPEGLEDRLLRIPAEPLGVGWARVGRRPFVIAAALAAVLLLAVGAWLLFGPVASRRAGPLETLALLAMNDHLDTHTLDVSSVEPGVVAAGLHDRIPFDISFPDLGTDIRLAGGRRCTLGSHPVCFTTWRKGGVRFTLLQLRRPDFDLPAELAPSIVTPAGAAAGVRPLDVLIWTTGEFGWALVADDPTALRDVHPRTR